MHYNPILCKDNHEFITKLLLNFYSTTMYTALKRGIKILSLHPYDKSYKILIITLGVLTIGAKLLDIITYYNDTNPQASMLTILLVVYYIFAAALYLLGTKIKTLGNIDITFRC